jgi:hypothetical protein
MKTCSICKEEKSLEDFHKKSAAKDGRQSQCKVCNTARVVKWQAENSERYVTSWQKYNAATGYGFKKRAKKYGLTTDELQSMIDDSGGVCKICELPPNKWLVVEDCFAKCAIRLWDYLKTIPKSCYVQ